MDSFSERHLQRCEIETIPAVVLEEAIVERLRELSHDKSLMAKLVTSSASEAQERLEHQRSLLSTKEQERRKVQLKLDNLLEAISEETDRGLRGSLSEKAKDFRVQLDQVEAALMSLKEECSKASSNVVNLNLAFGILKSFRQGFQKQPISVQAEILNDVVKRIVVHSDKVVAEFYGSKPVRIPLSDDGLLGKNKGEPVSAYLRSRVRPVFKVVDQTGIEPATS